MCLMGCYPAEIICFDDVPVDNNLSQLHYAMLRGSGRVIGIFLARTIMRIHCSLFSVAAMAGNFTADL